MSTNEIIINGLDNTITIFKNQNVVKTYPKHFHHIAEKEYNLVANLNHQNLVKTLAFIVDPDSTSIIYEYVGGGDLFDYLNIHKPLKNDIIKNVIKDIYAVLKYLHEHFILHQDVKLENVLIENVSMENNNTVQTFKLCDFNRSINIETPKFEIPKGTAAINVPPEAVPYANSRTKMQLAFTQDIWGFGTMIYEMAYYETLPENLKVIPTHNDPFINKVLQNCLKYDPQERNFGV